MSRWSRWAIGAGLITVAATNCTISDREFGSGNSDSSAGGDASEGGAANIGTGGGDSRETICDADEPACDGNRATSCNADGTGYLAGGLRCSSKQVCLTGACEQQECTPNARFCFANVVRKCVKEGLYSEEVVACEDGQYCDDASVSCKATDDGTGGTSGDGGSGGRIGDGGTGGTGGTGKANGDGGTSGDGGSGSITPAGPFTLTSEEISDGQPIPETHTCDGGGGFMNWGVAPSFKWENPPSGTMSYAFFMIDWTLAMKATPDVNGYQSAAWNIPTSITELASGWTASTLGGEAKVLYGGYLGPCPPTGTDSYHMIVMALPTASYTITGTGTAGVRTAYNTLKAVALATAEITGTYQKN